jgi:hypothetical protein
MATGAMGRVEGIDLGFLGRRDAGEGEEQGNELFGFHRWESRP